MTDLRLRDLIAVLDRLPARDADFARDVIASVKRRGAASEKQSAKLRELYAKATAPKAAQVDLSAIVGMFAQLDQKKPALRVACDAGELVVKRDDRRPGGLVVFRAVGGFAGTIGRDGKADMRNAVELAALARFADDPAAAAKAYGDATSACCFCAQELTDPRSIHAGYGPVCAENWGLPWGDTGKTAEPLRPVCEAVQPATEVVVERAPQERPSAPKVGTVPPWRRPAA